jgi:SEC-C motif-containing protein
MSNYCPCGNNKIYAECCEPFIMGKTKPATAEQLMRSRYTAYSKGKVDYLLKTHERSTRPTKERNKLLKWMNSVEWLGLVIVKIEKGQAEDPTGQIEFRAVFMDDGFTQAIHEKSVFVKNKGHWLYASGTQY